MDLISSLPNHITREMTPKGNVIRECTEIQQVIRDPDTPFQTLLFKGRTIRKEMGGGRWWKTQKKFMQGKRQEKKFMQRRR